MFNWIYQVTDNYYHSPYLFWYGCLGLWFVATSTITVIFCFDKECENSQHHENLGILSVMAIVVAIMSLAFMALLPLIIAAAILCSPFLLTYCVVNIVKFFKKRKLEKTQKEESQAEDVLNAMKG